MGTFGNRSLAVTGRLADGWIPSYGYAPPESVGGLRARIVEAARSAGRDPEELTYAYHVPVLIGRDSSAPGVVAGSADEVAERLASFTRLGFTALSLVPSGPDPSEQVELLARAVVPAVRALLNQRDPDRSETGAPPWA